MNVKELVQKSSIKVRLRKNMHIMMTLEAWERLDNFRVAEKGDKP